MLTNNNPYTFDVNREILSAMNIPEEPPTQNFFYPATVTYILLPFWLMPWVFSISLWMGLSLVLLNLLPIIVFRTLNWRISPVKLFIITLTATFIYRYSMISYVIGQYVIWILTCLIFAWVGISRNQDWLVALSLIGSTVRPEGIVITALFLLELLLQKHWRSISIWMTSIGILFVLSVLQIGLWIPQFLELVRTYSEQRPNYYPPSVFGNFSTVFTIGVLTWFSWVLWQTHPLDSKLRTLWRLSSAFLCVLLVFPQSNPYTLIYGLLPVWIIIWTGKDWKALAVTSIPLLLPWVFYIANLPTLLETLIIPLTILVLLTIYWQRFKTSSTYEKSTLHLS